MQQEKVTECNILYMILENNPKQKCVLIGLKPCFYNSIETHKLAQAVNVNVMMAREKRIYILMIKVKKLIFLLHLCIASRVRTAFLVLLNFHLCFYNSTETWFMFSNS